MFCAADVQRVASILSVHRDLRESGIHIICSQGLAVFSAAALSFRRVFGIMLFWHCICKLCSTLSSCGLCCMASAVRGHEFVARLSPSSRHLLSVLGAVLHPVSVLGAVLPPTPTLLRPAAPYLKHSSSSASTATASYQCHASSPAIGPGHTHSHSRSCTP